MTTPDFTLTPAADGTFCVTPRVTAAGARREEMRRALGASMLGHFLGWDPGSATDRAEIERRFRAHIGAGITFVWAKANGRAAATAEIEGS